MTSIVGAPATRSMAIGRASTGHRRRRADPQRRHACARDGRRRARLATAGTRQAAPPPSPDRRPSRSVVAAQAVARVRVERAARADPTRRRNRPASPVPGAPNAICARRDGRRSRRIAVGPRQHRVLRRKRGQPAPGALRLAANQRRIDRRHQRIEPAAFVRSRRRSPERRAGRARGWRRRRRAARLRRCRARLPRAVQQQIGRRPAAELQRAQAAARIDPPAGVGRATACRSGRRG